MRVFAVLCNNILLISIEIVTFFLFLLKNIYHIYLTFVILRVSACFSKAKTNNKQT